MEHRCYIDLWFPPKNVFFWFWHPPPILSGWMVWFSIQTSLPWNYLKYWATIGDDSPNSISILPAADGKPWIGPNGGQVTMKIGLANLAIRPDKIDIIRYNSLIPDTNISCLRWLWMTYGQMFPWSMGAMNRLYGHWQIASLQKGIPNDAKLLQDDFEIRILHVFTILFYHLRSQLLVYLLVLNIGISNV